MIERDELVLRLAARRSRRLGLSDSGYAELLRAVQKDPANFLDESSDEAFSLVVKALGRYDESTRADEFLDDESFFKERARRMERLHASCAEALAIDENCVDARLVDILTRDLEPDALLDGLLGIAKDANGHFGTIPQSALEDAWTDVFSRGRLRVQAAISRTCLDSARYRMADAVGREMMEASPSDVLGLRHTCALALARLEDEAGFDALDAHFGRRGDCWVQLGRMILFYKLGRTGAALRALKGLDTLCDGGIYALLRPTMVDTYMPDRPQTQAYGFDECVLAVHEAEPIIVDTPDFILWAQTQPGMLDSAEAYARKSGFDW